MFLILVGFILAVITLCLAAPTKSPNGCGYDVREHLCVLTNYQYDVSLGM